MIKTITIKDSYIPELTEVFGETYQAEIWDEVTQTMIPNPQTKGQFASARFDTEWKQYVGHRVQAYRRNIADLTINTEPIIE